MSLLPEKGQPQHLQNRLQEVPDTQSMSPARGGLVLLLPSRRQAGKAARHSQGLKLVELRVKSPTTWPSKPPPSGPQFLQMNQLADL